MSSRWLNLRHPLERDHRYSRTPDSTLAPKIVATDDLTPAPYLKSTSGAQPPVSVLGLSDRSVVLVDVLGRGLYAQDRIAGKSYCVDDSEQIDSAFREAIPLLYAPNFPAECSAELHRPRVAALRHATRLAYSATPEKAPDYQHQRPPLVMSASFGVAPQIAVIAPRHHTALLSVLSDLLRSASTPSRSSRRSDQAEGLAGRSSCS